MPRDSSLCWSGGAYPSGARGAVGLMRGKATLLGDPGEIAGAPEPSAHAADEQPRDEADDDDDGEEPPRGCDPHVLFLLGRLALPLSGRPGTAQDGRGKKR